MDAWKYDYINARCRFASQRHRRARRQRCSAVVLRAHYPRRLLPSEGMRSRRATGSVCEVNSIRPPFLKSLQRPVSWTAHFNVSVSGLGRKRARSGLFTRHTLSCNLPPPPPPPPNSQSYVPLRHLTRHSMLTLLLCLAVALNDTAFVFLHDLQCSPSLFSVISSHTTPQNITLMHRHVCPKALFLSCFAALKMNCSKNTDKKHTHKQAKEVLSRAT